MTPTNFSSLSPDVASWRRPRELHADGAPGAARDHRVAVFFKERAVHPRSSFDPLWRR
jgi:hypothetical protein